MEFTAYFFILLGLDERIILNGYSRNGLKGRGLHWSDSGYGLMAGCCEEGNEPSDSIKCWGFLDYL